MAEKLVDKIKRLSRDLAESVRAEIEMGVALRENYKQFSDLKRHVRCYLSDREDIHTTGECLTFLKGYYEAKEQKEADQLRFSFTAKR